jgi:hypothetical protein
VLLFLASLAHAGLRADLTTLAQEPADVRMACSSADAAIAGVDAFVQGVASTLGDDEAKNEELRAIAALRAAQLFAPGAKLQVLVRSDSAEARFETTSDAATLARALAGAVSDTTAVEDADGWVVTKGEKPRLRVSVANGRAPVPA